MKLNSFSGIAGKNIVYIFQLYNSIDDDSAIDNRAIKSDISTTVKEKIWSGKIGCG